MSDNITSERTKILVMCRNFVKAEVQAITSGSELDKSLVAEAWEKVSTFVEDKATARNLAVSQVAEQYLKG